MWDVTTVRLCEFGLPMSRGDNLPLISYENKPLRITIIISMSYLFLWLEERLLLTRGVPKGEVRGRVPVTHNKPVVGKKDQAYRK